MRHSIVFIFSFLLLNTAFAQKSNTDIYIIGNIHDSVPNYNSHILFEILDHIKPDIILHEVDSEGMKEYEANNDLKGNEIKASSLYVEKNPSTLRFHLILKEETNIVKTKEWFLLIT